MRLRHEALLPIYQNCLFQSDEPARSHWQVAQELAPHSLVWNSGNIDTAMYKCRLNRVEAYVLRYGAQVQITPEPFSDFVLVDMPLRGAIEIRSEHLGVNAAQGRVAVLGPQKSKQILWREGTEQLILKLPLSLVGELQDRHHGSNLALAPCSLIPSALTPQWHYLMQSALNIMQLPSDAGLNPLWLDNLEQQIALFALSHQELGAPHKALGFQGKGQADLAGASSDARRMDAALGFMQQHMSGPISLADVAAAAGVSMRTLNSLCNQQLGTTPMETLRNLRLDAVRQKLRQNPQASITITAMEAGFGHLGRFASYYLQRFGELPRQTSQQHLGDQAGGIL